MSQPADICSQLNLSGTVKSVCEMLVPPLYELYQTIEPKLPILTAGLNDIIQKDQERFFIHNAIYQQLPWLVSFIALAIVLVIIKVMPFYLAVLLVILALLVTAMLVYLNLESNKRNIDRLIDDVQAQVSTNVANFEKSFITAAPSPSPGPSASSFF